MRFPTKTGRMQIEELHPQFDSLQKEFGDRALRAIYGAGCVNRPDVCFVFMNPTGKNVSASPEWNGLRAPWIGTKNIWKLFLNVGILGQETHDRIQAMRAEEWTPAFAEDVYRQLAKKKTYVTNLSKSTQRDARHLPDSLFKRYLPFLHQEIAIVKPRVVISLGNQVSSILLDQPIKVAEHRKRSVSLAVDDREYPAYPVYYPVGQGMRNMDKAAEDIRWIMNTQI